MNKKPNVLWLMSDQHNSNCTGYRNHPNVKTPNLDKIAQQGVEFTNGFANNPICSPSRICFMTGQYVRNHGMLGNHHSDFNISNSDTMACVFRRFGYQTGLFGKSHMVPLWDREGFEKIRYTDMCDADREDPATNHYFKYLEDQGLADFYEEGNPKSGQKYTMDGSAPAVLPYEHSIERYTGNETLQFLEVRDLNRPFFIHMSFQRPHAPIAPSEEHFNLYNSEEMVLPENSFDYFENRFKSKPSFMREKVEKGYEYPMADPNPDRLKRCLASYYALITAIDSEIGRVLERLEEMGELDNTIIFYTADHGDFAGEHGLFHKNFGIYDSIQRIPFLLSWPGGPKGVQCKALVESVDLYPTLCELCGIPLPSERDGASLLPVVKDEAFGKNEIFCEWEWQGRRVSAVRNKDFRLVFYTETSEGELYDHHIDSGETNNLWEDHAYVKVKAELIHKILNFKMGHRMVTDYAYDRQHESNTKYAPTFLVQKKGVYWSELKKTYSAKGMWPPKD